MLVIPVIPPAWIIGIPGLLELELNLTSVSPTKPRDCRLERILDIAVFLLMLPQ